MVSTGLGFFLLGGVKFSPLGLAGIALNTVGGREAGGAPWCISTELYVNILLVKFHQR